MLHRFLNSENVLVCMVNETSIQGGFFTDLFANSFLTNLIVALIILLVGFIVGKLLGRVVGRVLHEIEVNSIVKKASGVNLKIESFASSFVSYFIYFVAILMALDQLNVKTIVLYFISVAVLVVIALSFLLGLKDFVPNLFSGFFIYRNKLVEEGDVIEVSGIKGKVVQVTLFETKIKTKKGDLIFIPNSSLVKSKFVKKKSR